MMANKNFALLAALLLAGTAFAWQGQASSVVTSSYENGNTYGHCIDDPSMPFTVYTPSASIMHNLGVNVTLTQNSQDANQDQFAPGLANLALHVSTNATMGRIVYISSYFPDGNAQASPAQALMKYNSAEYSSINSQYGNCYSLDQGTKNLVGSGLGSYVGYHFLNWPGETRTDSGKVVSIPCPHTFNSADAVTVNVDYKPCASAYANTDLRNAERNGMGKAYMYCTATLAVNGHSLGAITSNEQDFSTQVTLTQTTTSFQVTAQYQCYVAVEGYIANIPAESVYGGMQEPNQELYRPPNGNPVQQTVTITNVPIITPPVINLVPLININGNWYKTDTTIPVTRNQQIPLTFWVNRTDTWTTTPTPQITWRLSGTPVGLTPGTYPNYHLVPVLYPPIPGELIPTTGTPQTITVCRSNGPTSEMVTLRINSDGSIQESNPNDDTITLTFECSSTSHQDCDFIPNQLPLYAGETGFSTMTCKDSETGEREPCGSLYSVSGPSYTQYFGSSHAADNSGTYRNWIFTVVAQPPADQDTMSKDDQITARTDSESSGCTLNLNWRRPDCRYYM